MKKRKTSDELRQLYTDAYISNFEQQPLKRITRLLGYLDLRPTDVIADYACGNGMLLDLVHSKVHSYVGIDFSDGFIASARVRARHLGVQNAQFVQGDIVEFCAANNERFDRAFTIDFSEHVYDDDFVHIYKAIRSSLKENGELCIHTPNGDYFIEILKQKGVMKQFPEHVAVRNSSEYLKLLTLAGFCSITVHYLPHYLTVLRCFHFLSYSPIVGKFFKARLILVCKK